MFKKDKRIGELLGYWEQASKQDYGIKIGVAESERRMLSQQLYRARAYHGGFRDFVILTPDGKEELWIIRRDADERAEEESNDNG